VGPERIGVRLVFNEAGEIAQTVAERPRVEDGNALVPTRGEVRWKLPSSPFTYWRGTITSFEFCR
jgi:hypothetical protein